MEKQFEAQVVTVSDVVKTKKNSISTFNVCTVKFLEGKLAGKQYFAQRTLTDKNGNKKSPVNVGQKVTVYLSVVENLPFFEIGTGGGSVDSAEDIMALLS
jgi:hypothetical protein